MTDRTAALAETWEAMEAAIWPDGPAHGRGSGVYAQGKGAIEAEIARLRPIEEAARAAVASRRHADYGPTGEFTDCVCAPCRDLRAALEADR